MAPVPELWRLDHMKGFRPLGLSTLVLHRKSFSDSTFQRSSRERAGLDRFSLCHPAMQSRTDDWSAVNLERLRGVPVVVVDPDPAAACPASSLLAHAGCSVRRLRTAEEALVVVQTLAP